MKKLLQRLKTHASAAVVAIAAIGSSAALTNEAQAATFDFDAGTFTVEAGDTMSAIASTQLAAHGVEGFNYTHFARSNGMNTTQASRILPGQVLQLPADVVTAYFEANPPIAVTPVQITLSPSVLAQQEYMLALDAQEDEAAAPLLTVQAPASPAPATPAVTPLTAAQDALAAQTAAEAEAETARIALEAAEGDKARVHAELEEAQRALDEATSALEAAQAAHDQAVAANQDLTVTQAALEAAQAAHASAQTTLSGVNVAYSAVEEAAEDAQTAHLAATQAAAEAAAETARLSVAAVSRITADPAICVAGDATGPQTTCKDVLVSESDAADPVAAMFDNLDQARNAEIQALQDAHTAEQEKLAALEAAHAEANAISAAALQSLVDTNCAEAVQERVRAVADAAAAERLADIEAARAALVTMQSEIDALVEADAAAEQEAEEIQANVCKKECAVEMPPAITPPTEMIEAEACGLIQTLLNYGHNTGRLYDWNEVFEDPRNAHLFPTGDPSIMLEGELIVDQVEGNYEVVEIDPSKVVSRCLPPAPIVSTPSVSTPGVTTPVATPRPTLPQCSATQPQRGLLGELFSRKTLDPQGDFACCTTERLPVGPSGERIWVYEAPFCTTPGDGGRDPEPEEDNEHGGGCNGGGCGGDPTPDRDDDGEPGGPGNPGGPAGAGAASGTDSSGDAGGQDSSDASVLRGRPNNAFAALDVPAQPIPIQPGQNAGPMIRMG